jgi:hypothetical protein
MAYRPDLKKGGGKGTFCSMSCSGRASRAKWTLSAPDVPTRIRALSANSDNPDVCWIWKGSIDRLGYGRISLGDKLVKAHRAAFMTFVSAIPPGMHVLHKCDVRACCNPQHLFLGTHAENMRDMAVKGRAKARSKPELHT